MTSSPTEPVRVWEEPVVIPTYRIGTPDKNPMFLDKRVYQGSSGVVYPHPIIDRVFDDKEDKTYQAVYLENRYLKIMLLPEIGGRVQMALDKTNGYHFIYYNRVIKPALVGLTGPWISGGIEFNWPQHHRPSTFEPVDTKIETNDDGSQTVWLSEIERMFRTKGMAGFTLYPDRAYLEIKVKLYNRTSQPQTFLWWANPAVHVNEDYQSVFPPDVRAVMDHGKRDVSTFPIATGTYYKMDYSAGVDISRYKNIPVPTSFMAAHSDYDFLGCYDHGQQAGMLHIANHHVVPGKKQWTWGNSDFGKAWDRQLTDEDGPYIELMCGAFTDNQPDFSWIQPGEEKSFTQIFMPYKGIGGVKNANKDVLINLDVEGDQAQIGVYVTHPQVVAIALKKGETVLYNETPSLNPDTAFIKSAPLPAGTRPQDLTLTVYMLSFGGQILRYTPLPDMPTSTPEPAKPAKLPAEIETNEELFLNGLHLEQYRHATYMPEPYYLEALRRDPLDSRCHTAMGRLLFQRGKFAEAEAHFRQAIEGLTRRNPNPYDGEAYYQLGLALKMQDRRIEAFDAFYKAVWSAAWQDKAYFELARIACYENRFEEALDLVERSLARNAQHHQARHLKIAIWRHVNQGSGAAAAPILRGQIDEALKHDPMSYGAWFELAMIPDDSHYQTLMRDNPNTYIELALDYSHASLFDEARTLLAGVKRDPMAEYFMGWLYAQEGDEEFARLVFRRAASLSPDYCFPNQIECVPALQAAMKLNPTDSYAPYYLGNFWYAHRCHEDAIACWEQSRALNPNFATVHRNLGLAYVNQRGDLDAAWTAYETAFALNPQDARVFFELDQLAKKRNETPQTRLERLQAHPELVEQRDDLTIELITLLNVLGQHETALTILQTRSFHPWEGGEGKVTGQYVTSLVELAKQDLNAGHPTQAIQRLEEAQAYPLNLGEGKLHGAQENNIFYGLGCTFAASGDEVRAQAAFSRASTGLSEPTSAIFYNDQPPDMIFYQGLALQKLGQDNSARTIFQRLIDYGQAHLEDNVTIDYFAVSLPDFLVFDEDLNQRNRIHCHYMMALGALGLGDTAQAETHFQAILRVNAAHQGTAIHRARSESRQ